MKYRPPGLQLSDTFEGFINFKFAQGLSPITIESYKCHLNCWLEYQGDLDVITITSQHIRKYLNYMRFEYTPRRISGGNDRKLASMTIRSIWITLSAIFHWDADEFSITRPIQSVPPPKFTDPPVGLSQGGY